MTSNFLEKIEMLINLLLCNSIYMAVSLRKISSLSDKLYFFSELMKIRQLCMMHAWNSKICIKDTKIGRNWCVNRSASKNTDLNTPKLPAMWKKSEEVHEFSEYRKIETLITKICFQCGSFRTFDRSTWRVQTKKRRATRFIADTNFLTDWLKFSHRWNSSRKITVAWF